MALNNLNISIKSLAFNDQSTLTFNKNDIVIFVGANNCGKSLALREIAGKFQNKNSPGIIIKELIYSKTGTEEDLLNLIMSISVTRPNAAGGFHYGGNGFDFTRETLYEAWRKIDRDGLKTLQNLFLKHLTTNNRLQHVSPAKNFSIGKESPTHPINQLQLDESIEETLSKYFNKAFKNDLILNRGAGSMVPLHVGKKPTINTKNGEDRVSKSYLTRLNKLVQIHEQGDGMKAFAGILLNTFSIDHSVMLIDEPEAFLHPPQARTLGKMLVKEARANTQVFISTHSIDFLKGILDSNNPNIKIIRIERDENINRMLLLDKVEVNSIWSDSLLRQSNILDGLFYNHVIICESDSDCKFFSALLNEMESEEEIINSDILFIHCGGKERIATVVACLKKLNVKVSVIVDFDLLNNASTVEKIFTCMGGNWARLERDYNVLKADVESKKRELKIDVVKNQIEAILSKVTGSNLPKKSADEIRDLVKINSPWTEAKKIGKAFIPNGNASTSYNNLINELKNQRVFVIEVGEIEQFAKSIGGHGPAWVGKVIQDKNIKSDIELNDARKFILSVLE